MHGEGAGVSERGAFTRFQGRVSGRIRVRDGTATDVEWWSEIDEQLIGCLREGPKSPKELGRRLGLTPGGITSLLLMLAAEGKVRVASVELAEA